MVSKGSFRQKRTRVAMLGGSPAVILLTSKNEQAMKRLQKQQRLLRSLLEQRTSELEALRLANRDLKQVELALTTAKNAAEAASRAKDQFVRNMSHELRTPINGVLGMTQVTLDTDLTEEQREYLAIVKESADSLLALVNNVLDHSAIDHQELTLQPVLFNPAECLAELRNETEPKASAKGLEVRFEAGPELQTMLVGDWLRLKQVITNLVDNALKFTSCGSVCVCASLDEGGKESVELQISVSDTGIGITAEQQRRMFDAFSQADVSDTRQYGGIGLGLALSSQLVRLMGGQICAESEVGVGSKFSFSAVCARPKVFSMI